MRKAFISAAIAVLFAASASFAQTGATGGAISPTTPSPPGTTQSPSPTTTIPLSTTQLLPPATTGNIPGTTSFPDNDTIITGRTLEEDRDSFGTLERPFGEESLDTETRTLREFDMETETRTLTESETETPTTILGRETDSDLSEDTESQFEEDRGAGGETGPGSESSGLFSGEAGR